MVISVKQASESASAALPVKKKELAPISFPMRWVEGHISHCSWVLRCCHPEQSLCSGEFGCRSFIKHSPWTVCFLLVVWKKLACFYEPQFCRVSPSISLSDSALETKKLQAEVLKSTCRTIQVLKLLQKADFDSLTLLTALLLYSQSDYLNYTKRDSDWLTLACFMRV